MTDSRDRAALIEHDRRFFDALVAGDAARLGELLADDFLLVGVEDGSVVPRSALLDAVAAGAVTFPAIESFPEEAVVRRIGDVGIVVGRTGMNFVNSDGTGFVAGSRYTHVFAKDSATGWRLVSAQGTRITSADR
ncbi:YybH family protein [Streptomyces rubellomurinus]|uniref:DUF4440 domain-containing protein n=1 Tax=Streptomyces rubellomurinus (strain ATCC 31215) TaxID=359131 RepID=A0A0F2TH19_STRR3|nr:nuclear transport factor 2 family protein [Streptomyces rubellomurinus]KJS61861.1 hypothetical protein VM95_12820 [Streptomyces rubellomurinus]